MIYPPISWRTAALSIFLGSGSLAAADPLHDAVRSGDPAAVAEAIAGADDMDQTDFVLGSPLHVAVAEQQFAIARLLIENGAGVDAASEIRGKTALHLASELGDTEMVRLLLENAADVHARGEGGQAAIHIATRAGNPDVVAALIEAGAEVDSRDPAEGFTPLMIASLQGDFDSVKLLVDAGADIEAASDIGRTPFFYAASMESYSNVGSDALIRYFAALGVDMSPEDESGITPLKWAMARNVPAYFEIVQILKELGVDR